MNDDSREIIEVMKDLFDTLNRSNQEIKAELNEVKKRVIKIETTQENEVRKNIGLLADGYSLVSEQLSELVDVPDQLTDIKADISLIKKAVASHSAELNRLPKAK